jgi:CHASE3 domain sensor protein/nitrogen-specific signal transduction histidine kinase
LSSCFLALISLPPLTNGRADMLRAHLDTDVQDFANALTATENSLQEMQAATRGYILTQAPAFLEQYRAAQDGLPARLQDLTQLGPQVDPALEAPVADLVQVVERWQHEGGDRLIDLTQQGRAADAIAEVSAGNTQALFDSLRNRINDLQEQTQATQLALREQVGRMRTLQVSLTSGLGMLGLVAVGFIIFSFRSMVALMRDLQAERERTAALAREARTERQRLQAVFDHSPEGIVFAEAPIGQISLANPAAVALLGPPVLGAGLRAQRWVECVYRPGGEPCPVDDLPLVRSVEHGEACRSVELIIEQPDRQRVPVLVTSVPLYAEDGGLRGAVAVFQDLRLLREVERLKSDFVALVSHELRTPLTAIQGCVQTLLTGGIANTTRTQEFLQIIAEQGDRLQELIDNLLSLSQVEAGALRLRRELAKPEQLIQGVLRQLRDRLSNLRVQTDLAPRLALISADGRRIEQVLFNLLDNARKFSPPGREARISSGTSSTPDRPQAVVACGHRLSQGALHEPYSRANMSR